MDTLILFILVGVLLLTAVLVFVYISLCFVVVKQGTRKIVERFGVYRKTLKEGVHIIWRPFDKIAPVPWDVLSITERDDSNREYVNSAANSDLGKYTQLRDEELAKLIKADLVKAVKAMSAEAISAEEAEKISVDAVVENMMGTDVDSLVKTVMFAENRIAVLEDKYRRLGVKPSSELVEQVRYHDAVSKTVRQHPSYQDPKSKSRKARHFAENHVLDYIDLRERYIDSELHPVYDAQCVITKDNASIKVNTIVFFYITDCFMYYYGAEEPEKAMALLTISTLRNTIASMTLEEALQSRVEINKVLRETLDNATNTWGIKVSRVEIKEFILGNELTEAMNTVLISERQKRATITLAEGRARDIELVRMAEAEGYKRIKESGLDERVLRVRECEALEKVADGKATKIFMPNNITSSVADAHILADAFKDEKAPVVEEKEVVHPEVVEAAE